jgi:N-methylhydantoinase A
MPFGGAGPMHAAALAGELGIERILCPRASGVLSALGLVASERRRDTARTVMLSGDELRAERIAAEVATLRETIAAGLEDAEAEATYELRYRGQAFELAIAGSTEPDPAELIAAFEAEHERRYGHRNADAEIELVNIGLALAVPGPEIEPRAAIGRPARRSQRRAHFGGEWLEAEVLRGEPEVWTEARGPCILELPEATLVLPPGWSAVVDEHGTVVAKCLSTP